MYVGCSGLEIDSENRTDRLGGRDFAEGDWVSIDANGGTVYLGRGQIVVERPKRELAEVKRWLSQRNKGRRPRRNNRHQSKAA